MEKFRQWPADTKIILTRLLGEQNGEAEASPILTEPAQDPELSNLHFGNTENQRGDNGKGVQCHRLN